jgi:hypothetical protein
MPINPDFSALEAVITAKVESVATNIDNKDLLIQMKALEAAVANLALTRVIAEGTYQQGQVTATANNAVTTLNDGVSTATTNLNTLVNTAADSLNTASEAALASFTATSGAVIVTIEGLLAELGDTNTQDIIDLVVASLASITNAADVANAAITQLLQDALTVISSTGTTAVGSVNDARDFSLDAVSGAQTSAISGINTARDTAIAAVSASGDVNQLIEFVRNDRWLGLNIFAPTNYSNN